MKFREIITGPSTAAFLATTMAIPTGHKLFANDEIPDKPFSSPDYSDNMDVPPPPPKDRPPREVGTTQQHEKRKEKRHSLPTGTWDGGGGGRVTISPGIGFGTGYVAAQLDVTYYFNSWIAVASEGYYRNTKDDSSVEMIDYGPEVDLMVFLPNPTVVTPFAGAGPGYQKWVIRKDGVNFDDSTAVTANYLAGLDIGLSKHFSLVLNSKTTTYLQDPPRVYPDPDKFRPRTQNRVFIGFKVSFQI